MSPKKESKKSSFSSGKKTESVSPETPSEADDHSVGSDHYQVVARRYRPRTFEQLVGQEHIAQALSNALTTGRVGHAYLFTGARGVGKTSTARIFAKSLNCEKGPTLTPCGVCDSCINVSTGEDIDVIEIDGASNRGIDEIRLLRQNASICPSRSRYKIYIIDEVHMLTREAFNALLKTLEEPPDHVKFIFCTTEPSKIPITILSRCQRFDFAGIESSAITSRLAAIAADENVTVDDGVLETLSRRAAGSMRDAQSLLEQLLSFAPKHIALSDVHDMLGTANDGLLYRLLEAMQRCEPAVILSELEAASGEGVDFGILIEQLMGLFRDLLVVASGGNDSLLLFCSPGQMDDLKATAETFGLHRIIAALQILDQTHSRMRYSTQGRVLTELALVRIAHLEHFQMISVLLDQLREGSLSGAVPPPASTMKPVQRVLPSPPAATKPQEPKAETNGKSFTPDASSAREEPAPKTPETPQQRLAAASAPRAVELDELTSIQAQELWHEIVEEIPGMLGSSAGSCLAVEFEKPQTFVISFENKMALEFCEKESPRLQNALNQAIGQAIRIRFVLKEAAKKAPAATEAQRKRNPAERNALLKEAASNPLVQKVEELFGAELFDVK